MVVGSFAGSLLIAEVLLRFLVPLPEVRDFERFDYVTQNQEPRSIANKVTWWWSSVDGQSFKHHQNLYSFRDVTWPLAPAERNRSRVLFLGDSFVEGFGASDDDTIPRRFALETQLLDVKTEPLNMGVGGFGLIEYLAIAGDAVPLFRPDAVIVVIYVNDLFRPPVGEEIDQVVSRGLSLENPLAPRIHYVLRRRRRGLHVPLRTHRDQSNSPKPLSSAAWKSREKQIDRFVDPEIASAMKRGEINPAVTNHLARTERQLRLQPDIRHWLGAVRDVVASGGATLSIVYIPSLNQVTDNYLPQQRRLSAQIPVDSLTGPAYKFKRM